MSLIRSTAVLMLERLATTIRIKYTRNEVHTHIVQLRPMALCSKTQRALDMIHRARSGEAAHLTLVPAIFANGDR
jgi:hypothetical protein